jgi:hypothetical protein
MNAAKWVTISVMIVFLWVDVFVLWIAYTNPLIGAVLTSIFIPLSIGIFKLLISDWKNS